MTENELKKLRAYYHSLLGQQRIFEDATRDGRNIESQPVRVLENEVGRIEQDFPGLVPPLKIFEFLEGEYTDGSRYYISGIRSYLSTALGRLKVSIDVSETTPVTEIRNFSFVNDTELRRVLERDYSEIQRGYIAKCWKSVIILSGSAIEAVLTDLLLQHQSAANSATKAPSQTDITKWVLASLIDVAVELQLISPSAEKLSHSVREYRNLVHPGNEIRNRLTFDQEEAKIALEVLHIVHRDLSP